MVQGLVDMMRRGVRDCLTDLLEDAGKAAAVAMKMGVPLSDSYSAGRDDLTRYLDTRLSALHDYLYDDVFRMTVRVLWKMVCSEYELAILDSPKRLAGPQLLQFKRILTVLKDFFHADGDGLPMGYLRSAASDLGALTVLVPASTEHLIDMYAQLERQQEPHGPLDGNRESTQADSAEVKSNDDDGALIESRHIVRVLNHRKKDDLAVKFVQRVQAANLWTKILE